MPSVASVSYIGHYSLREEGGADHGHTALAGLDQVHSGAWTTCIPALVQVSDDPDGGQVGSMSFGLDSILWIWTSQPGGQA